LSGDFEQRRSSGTSRGRPCYSDKCEARVEWPREAQVFDYLSLLPYIGFAAVALGVAGLMLSRRKAPATAPEPSEVVVEWRPTGKIDFVQTSTGGANLFYLQTEEYRVLQSMSGTRHVEVRWRLATLEEAKRVASWNNSRETILGLPVSESIRTAALAPSLVPAEPLADGDEHSRVLERRH
jgi:hypothetical protein